MGGAVRSIGAGVAVVAATALVVVALSGPNDQLPGPVAAPGVPAPPTDGSVRSIDGTAVVALADDGAFGTRPDDDGRGQVEAARPERPDGPPAPTSPPAGTPDVEPAPVGDAATDDDVPTPVPDDPLPGVARPPAIDPPVDLPGVTAPPTTLPPLTLPPPTLPPPTLPGDPLGQGSPLPAPTVPDLGVGTGR